MKIRRLVLGRTINTGNYESVRIDIDVEVDSIEDGREVEKRLEVEVDLWEKQLKEKYHVKAK